MKKIIDGVIVVEGKSDVVFLNEFIDAEFVTTNGSEISKDTIEYIKKISEKRNVYVLTDPDSPGKRIRDILDQNIPNLKHCFVKKENCIKHGKVGVAESNQVEVLEALNNAITTNKLSLGNITMSDLFKLNLAGSDDATNKRNVVSNKLHFGYCNAKTFLKRLNNNGITIEEIEKLC